MRLSALSVLERYKRLRTAPTPGRRGTGMVTCNRELQVLSACFERVRSWGLVDAAWPNPVAKVKRFKESKGRERIVTYAEEAALLGALREPYRMLTQLGARERPPRAERGHPDHLGGRRPGQGALDHRRHPRQERTVPPPAPERGHGDAAARDAGDQHEPVRLRGPWRRPAPPLHKHVYFEAVRRLGLAGTGLNIHALRHTFASRMVESGADLTLLMALGGWSSLVMVQRYSHHRPERAVEGIARMLAARGRSGSPARVPTADHGGAANSVTDQTESRFRHALW